LGGIRYRFMGSAPSWRRSLYPTSSPAKLSGRCLPALTLANVLGVPAGNVDRECVGLEYDILRHQRAGSDRYLGDCSFRSRPGDGTTQHPDISGQLKAFQDRNLLASLAITALGWVGFMTFYGYIAPGRTGRWLWRRRPEPGCWSSLEVGLVIGNMLGGPHGGMLT